MSKKKLPQEIFVYVVCVEEGVPVYGVAINVDEIPEDCHGEKVGNYTLNNEATFRVKRELE